MATGKLQPRASVDWVGSLATVPLAQVVRRIALEEGSGDLQLNLGSVIKTVYFDHGRVVFAASNLKRDRLGESLIEAGRISRHEFALASMLMKGSRRKFGQALVQAGVMLEEELGRQVAMQVNRIVLSLFKTSDGIYSFDERGTVIPVELMVSLSIYRILLEGVRHMTNGKLILSGLPPLNTMLRFSEHPPFTPKRLKPLEQSILRAAGHGAPLAALIQQADADRGLALRACYALYAAGLLEPVTVSRRPRPLKVQEETGHFVLSEIQQKFANIKATNAKEEILMEFDRLDRASEAELLNLEGLASQEQIAEAYDKRLADWEKKKALVEAQQTLVAKVEVIQARLQKACRRMLAERERAADAETPASVEPIPSRGSAPAEPVLQTAREDTLPPLNEEYIEEVGIESEEPAPSELVDTQPPEARDAEEEAIGLVEETQPDKAKRSGVSLTGAAKHERIRQLLRDVKLHFQVRDWEHAVSLLYELVDLAPDEASHHAMLARAMARHPVMRKDAERHFIEALRLAPQDADLHYSLGLYYKSFGMHSRAQNEFRTALRINPRHEGARKHFAGGGRGKDPLRDVFKKIFG